MKASDYYAEYHNKMMMDERDIKKLIQESESEEEAQKKLDEFIRSGISELMKAMNREVKEICDKRNCKFDSAGAAVIREMNDKWNALIPKFEKEYGKCPLRRNGFAIFWLHEIPGLSKYIKIGGENN